MTALATTQSEIITPILDNRGAVIGTLDIESELPHAFSAEVQHELEECARALAVFWAR